MKVCLRKYNIIFMELIGVLLLHLCELIVRFPCNHANSLMFNYRDCILALVIFEVIYSVCKREFCIMFWVVFALSFALPIVEDRFNILISYDVWTSRGMPEWGHYGL